MGFFPTDAVNDQEVGPNANGSYFKYVAADNKWILIPNADVYSEVEVDAFKLNKWVAPDGPIAMNTQKFTGLTAGTGNGDSVRFEQLHTEGHVLATSGPHTGTLPWTDLNKTGSSLAHLATRTHASLSDAPANAHHVAFVKGDADALYSVLAHLHDDRYYTETEINTNTYTRTQVDGLIHTRLHAITDVLDHSANNHKIFYSNGAGQVVELALGADGQVLTSTGAATAPAFEAPGEGADNLGNHTASEDLKMATFAITGVGNVDGVDVSALKTAYDAHNANVGMHQDGLAEVINSHGYNGFIKGAIAYTDVYTVACSDPNAYVSFTSYIKTSGTYSVQILYSTSETNTGKTAGGRIYASDNAAPSLMSWDIADNINCDLNLATTTTLYRKTYGNVNLSGGSTIGINWGKNDNAGEATGNLRIHAIILVKVS